MDPLTMTPEQSCSRLDCTCGERKHLEGEIDKLRDLVQLVERGADREHDENYALRAKLTEVESDRRAIAAKAEQYENDREYNAELVRERDLALAAVQADNARMREALVDWADANDALRRAHLMLGMEDKQAQLKFRAAADKLMVIARSSPSSDAALREVCRKVQGATWAAAGPTVEMDAKKCNVILDAILGPEVTR